MFGDLVDLIRHTYRRVTSRRPMAVEVDLSGKNAIVTGGAENSIGYQVARTLAAWGADVVVTSLGDTDALERVLLCARYSSRRASIGSTRVARRAGSQQATSATATSTSGAATKVRRSSVVTP